MKAERQEQILKEIREIKRRLQLVEQQAAAFQKARAVSPRDAFQKKYPQLHLDPRLFKLVGIDPLLGLAEEKRAIREAVAARFENK